MKRNPRRARWKDKTHAILHRAVADTLVQGIARGVGQVGIEKVLGHGQHDGVARGFGAQELPRLGQELPYVCGDEPAHGGHGFILRGYEGTVRDESAALTEARAAVAADAAFGADMYQVLAEDAADTVFSPASVASALRMALCGARGETAAELVRALHLNGSDRQQDVAVSGLRLVSAFLLFSQCLQISRFFKSLVRRRSALLVKCGISWL